MQKTRRRFLYAGCGLATAGVLGGFARFAGRTVRPRESSPGPGGVRDSLITKTGRALGTKVTISVMHCDEQQAEDAIGEAFGQIEHVEQLMSLYRDDSQLIRLNRQRYLDAPDPELVGVLEYAASLSRRSQGAFDITVQPLWASYARSQRSGQLPSDSEIDDATRRVDWRRVVVGADRIELAGDGTAITLNGIAQGHAADRALAALRHRGIRHALVNTGELGAVGEKADGALWTVGLQHPRHTDAYMHVAPLSDRCLATSGDYETTFSSDFVHHHLFDPRTGRSPQEFSSVSVSAPTTMEADALSTAVFVLGLDRGLDLIRETPGAELFAVTKAGRTFATSGFPA